MEMHFITVARPTALINQVPSNAAAPLWKTNCPWMDLLSCSWWRSHSATGRFWRQEVPLPREERFSGKLHRWFDYFILLWTNWGSLIALIRLCKEEYLYTVSPLSTPSSDFQVSSFLQESMETRLRMNQSISTRKQSIKASFSFIMFI